MPVFAEQAKSVETKTKIREAVAEISKLHRNTAWAMNALQGHEALEKQSLLKTVAREIVERFRWDGQDEPVMEGKPREVDKLFDILIIGSPDRPDRDLLEKHGLLGLFKEDGDGYWSANELGIAVRQAIPTPVPSRGSEEAQASGPA